MSYIEKLESGYWHYRFNRNKFLQWGVGTAPTMADGFGWIEPGDLREALLAAEQADPKGQPKAAQQGGIT